LEDEEAGGKDGEEKDESGWKLVHGDVFRAPPCPMLFSATIGVGAQVCMRVVLFAFDAV
jgi:hypothetical protein